MTLCCEAYKRHINIEITLHIHGRQRDTRRHCCKTFPWRRFKLIADPSLVFSDSFSSCLSSAREQLSMISVDIANASVHVCSLYFKTITGNHGYLYEIIKAKCPYLGKGPETSPIQITIQVMTLRSVLITLPYSLYSVFCI